MNVLHVESSWKVIVFCIQKKPAPLPFTYVYKQFCPVKYGGLDGASRQRAKAFNVENL